MKLFTKYTRVNLLIMLLVFLLSAAANYKLINLSEIVSGAFTAIKKLARLNQSLLLLTRIGNQQFNRVENVPLKEKVEDKLNQQELTVSNKGLPALFYLYLVDRSKITDQHNFAIYRSQVLIFILSSYVPENCTPYRTDSGLLLQPCPIPGGFHPGLCSG